MLRVIFKIFGYNLHSKQIFQSNLLERNNLVCGNNANFQKQSPLSKKEYKNQMAAQTDIKRVFLCPELNHKTKIGKWWTLAFLTQKLISCKAKGAFPTQVLLPR